MPLQKSDANCSSANPRAKYISAMSAAGVGLYLLSSAIAWFADGAHAIERAQLAVAPSPLLSWIERWSVSSFWTNVELVAHSSTSRPPNSQRAFAVGGRGAEPRQRAVADRRRAGGRLHRRRIDDRRVDRLEQVRLDGVARREPAAAARASVVVTARPLLHLQSHISGGRRVRSRS